MDYQLKKYIQIGVIASVFYLIVKNAETIGGLLGSVASAVYPLILGAVIAYIMTLILNPVERIYFPKSKKKIVEKTRRPVCILISLLIILAAVAIISRIVVPEIVETCKLLGREIPIVWRNIEEWAMEKSSEIPQIQQVMPDLSDFDIMGTVGKVVNFVVKGTGGVLNSAFNMVSAVVGSVTNVVIAAIFAIYMLFNKEKLVAQICKISKAFFGIGNEGRVGHVLNTANKSFSSFILGQCTEAVILGVLCIIGMVIFRFPYAVMTGTVVGVTALIPIVGALLGAAVGAFMIFTVDPMQAIFFLIFLIILMQIEGNLIYPRVVGTSIGLPGMWVLAAVTVGGSLFGIPGMLIGVPLAATVYKLMRENVNERLAPKEEKTDEE